MSKQVKHLAELLNGLIKSERNNRSLTAIALARALRHAEILGEVKLELEDTFVEGDAFAAKLYKVRLRGRFGVLVHYELRDVWGSREYDHTEAGLAFLDSWSGHLELLHYEGQHAGREDFASKFRKYEAKLREYLRGGPFGYAEMAYPREGADLTAPRPLRRPRSLEEIRRRREQAKALDELQRQAQKLGLDYY